jgi:hypothetical protein
MKDAKIVLSILESRANSRQAVITTSMALMNQEEL